MIPLSISPNIDNDPWTECSGMGALSSIEKIGLLPDGTESGQPVVMIKMITPEGKIVVGETTWKLFRAAAGALSAAVETHGMMEGVPDE